MRALSLHQIRKNPGRSAFISLTANRCWSRKCYHCLILLKVEDVIASGCAPFIQPAWQSWLSGAAKVTVAALALAIRVVRSQGWLW